MFRFLAVYNNPVISNPTSGDNIPGGVASSTIWELMDIPSFLIGLFVGIISVFLIRGIIKYVKFIIKDNKEMAEKLKQTEANKNKTTESDK